MARAVNVTGPLAHHAEGPVWSEEWGGMRWVDLMAGDLLTLRGSRVDRLHVGTVAAFHRPRADGGFVVALERGLATAEAPDGPVRVLPDLWSDKGIRFNDGGCSPAGTLYGGTMAYDDGTGRGTLYRFDADLRPEAVIEGVTTSNGIAWSPDGELAYYNDTPTGQVDVLDNVDDRLGNRRRFTRVDGGLPDGLTVDAEGGVWVAVWGGGAVHRYTPDGLSEVVTLPVSQVSACTFGGDGLGTLYITTSAENLAEGAEAEAGSVYAVEPGVRGLPVTPWAG